MLLKKLGRLIAGSIASVGFGCSIAAAGTTLPRYDVNGYCNKVAGFGGNYSQELFGACMDQEQEAYDGLKPSWAYLPRSTRDYCNKVATFGGQGSYELLQACVQQESDAARKNSTRSFHY